MAGHQSERWPDNDWNRWPVTSESTLSAIPGQSRGIAGRLILAAIAGLGHQRIAKGGQHTPVHVVIDEASELAGPSLMAVLQELRKASIHLTLAQQVEGYGFGSEAKSSLFRNTAVKLVSGRATSELARLMDIPDDSGNGLQKGEFWCQWGHGTEPLRLRVRNDLANFHTQTTDAAWNAEMERQLARYYRTLPIGAPLPPIPKAPTPPRPRNREVE
jgi:hypothetical protein